MNINCPWCSWRYSIDPAEVVSWPLLQRCSFCKATYEVNEGTHDTLLLHEPPWHLHHGRSWRLVGIGMAIGFVAAIVLFVPMKNKDTDGDGVMDVDDNCPSIDNSCQGDHDEDGIGNKCDPDQDGDGVPNGRDKCYDILRSERFWVDEDRDGCLDNDDRDEDGILDIEDPCPDEGPDTFGDWWRDEDKDGCQDIPASSKESSAKPEEEPPPHKADPPAPGPTEVKVPPELDGVCIVDREYLYNVKGKQRSPCMHIVALRTGLTTQTVGGDFPTRWCVPNEAAEALYPGYYDLPGWSEYRLEERGHYIGTNCKDADPPKEWDP